MVSAPKHHLGFEIVKHFPANLQLDAPHFYHSNLHHHWLMGLSMPHLQGFELVHSLGSANFLDLAFVIWRLYLCYLRENEYLVEDLQLK